MLRKPIPPTARRSITAVSLVIPVVIAGFSFSSRLRSWIEPTALAANFTVNTAADHDDGTCNASDCTLREAINAVNAGSGGDTISFNISGAGVHTINLTSALPTLTKTGTIDGTTQPGFSGTPLIELNGAGAGASVVGLQFNAQNCIVKGLIINRFSGYGINTDSFSGLLVAGNYIGTDAAGNAASPNGSGGIRVNVGGVTIGGTSAAARNVISGNTGNGIDVVSGGATIQGNFIGTNTAGTAAVPNTVDGIKISGGSGTVGGTAAGAGNVISGNNGASLPAGVGVYITGGNGSQVQGNLIGTSASGTVRLPNQLGIIIDGAANNTIGGTSAAARNIISGNTVLGLEIVNAGATNNLVQGNFIGTDITGTVALGNGNGVNGDGIDVGQIGTGPSNVTIGGTAPGAGNLISGNFFEGILLFNDLKGVNVQGNLIGTDVTGHVSLGSQRVGIFINTTTPGAATIGGTTAAARNIISGNEDGLELNTQSTGITIQGNFIGTDITGTAAIPNTDSGMFVSTNNTIIGGTAAGAGNVISGNGGDGIGFGNAVTGNLVQGNFIGTKADGTSALGNAVNGVDFFTGASGNTVGGTTAGAGNVIAFNSRAGVAVVTGTGNAIEGNSIFNNSGLGIDLSPTGVNANDACDGDSGPNNLQNFPVLTSAAAGATNTTIQGTLNSTAGTQFRIEFFSNAACDPSGYGQGKVFVGSTNVTTDGLCNANINFIVPNASINGQFITATATDANNNTSEFSACVQRTTTNAVIQFSAANYNVGEGDGSVTITVNRTGDTGAFSSIDFSTGNNEYRPCTPGDPQNLAGIATQNCDFIRNQGTLVFNPGDTSKTFTVLIVDDAYVEGAETFPVTLSNLVGGPPAVIAPATVTIADNDSALASSPAPFRFSGALTGAQETPPNNSSGTGVGMVLLSQNQTSEQAGLTWSNLSSAQTVQHIHGAAAPGVAAPILFILPNGTPVTNFQINGLSAQQVSDLKSGLHYMNTHTVNLPNGEIRAQLLWNPTLEESFFVNEHYLDFLQRLPDPGGFNFWTGQISQCVTDVQCFHDRTTGVSNAFFYELEYQQTGAYAYRLFRESFGNTQPLPNPDSSNATEANKIPSYDAYAAVRVRVVGGANLTAGQQDAANVFATSPQFLARYPSSQPLDQFVDAILNTIQTDIGVNLSSQRTALIALGSRGAVLYRLANDDLQGGNGGINNRLFIDAEYNRAFVVTQYFGYLRRDGDIGGILFWKGQVDGAPLRDTSRQNAMVCSFITSDEYQKRFGPKSPRTNVECPH